MLCTDALRHLSPKTIHELCRRLDDGFTQTTADQESGTESLLTLRCR